MSISLSRNAGHAGLYEISNNAVTRPERLVWVVAGAGRAEPDWSAGVRLVDGREAGVSENLGDRIAARLLDEIVAGAFPPDTALPPEWELAEREGASRLTIREAPRTLRQKSVVRVVRGRGTYVQPPEHWSPLDPVVLGSLTRTRRAGRADERVAGGAHARRGRCRRTGRGPAHRRRPRRDDVGQARPAQAAWAMRDHLAQTGEDYARVPAARRPRGTRAGRGA